MLSEELARLPAAGDDLNDAVREASLLGETGEVDRLQREGEERRQRRDRGEEWVT